MGAIGGQLDFAFGYPAVPLKASLDVTRATGMHEILTVAPTDDDRGPMNDGDIDPESIGYAPNEIEGRVDPARFDASDVGPRNTDCIGELLLGDVEHGSGVPAEARKGHP